MENSFSTIYDLRNYMKLVKDDYYQIFWIEFLMEQIFD